MLIMVLMLGSLPVARGDPMKAAVVLKDRVADSAMLMIATMKDADLEIKDVLELLLIIVLVIVVCVQWKMTKMQELQITFFQGSTRFKVYRSPGGQKAHLIANCPTISHVPKHELKATDLCLVCLKQLRDVFDRNNKD